MCAGLPEVVTANEFFDYDAKYNGQVQEITPARLSDDVTRRVREITSHIYDILHCNGIIRIDYIISKEGKISMLEVNTTPGMTPTSFIPQQVRAAGLEMSETRAVQSARELIRDGSAGTRDLETGSARTIVS